MPLSVGVLARVQTSSHAVMWLCLSARADRGVVRPPNGCERRRCYGATELKANAKDGYVENFTRNASHTVTGYDSEAYPGPVKVDVAEPKVGRLSRVMHRAGPSSVSLAQLPTPTVQVRSG